MIWTDIIFSFLIALVFSFLLAFVYNWRTDEKSGLWLTLFVIFAILFFAVWAIGGIITPFGPKLFEGYWLPFVVVGIILSLFIIALIPPKARRKIPEEKEFKEKNTAGAKFVAGIFFWFLITALVVTIILRYIMV